jgi:hypothetical protein
MTQLLSNTAPVHTRGARCVTPALRRTTPTTYMRSPDWSTRYHAVADHPTLHGSSSVKFFTPTQIVFGGWRQPGQAEDPIIGRWLQDPDADIALPFLRCYGRNAVALILADPTRHPHLACEVL